VQERDPEVARKNVCVFVHAYACTFLLIEVGGMLVISQPTYCKLTGHLLLKDLLS
jgi:hypothetical protein